MYSTIRRGILLLTLASSLSVTLHFTVPGVWAQTYMLMNFDNFSHGSSKSCSSGDPHVHNSLYLGTFNEKDTPPFTITVRKSELLTDRNFTISAESQTSTGYMWMCVDILKEYDHLPVAKDRYGYYADILRTDFLMAVAQKGTSAHGISVSRFTLKHEGARDGNHGVGMKDSMKATLTINSGISEGKYFVVIAYGSPFRRDPMVSIKEILVNVVA